MISWPIELIGNFHSIHVIHALKHWNEMGTYKERRRRNWGRILKPRFANEKEK